METAIETVAAVAVEAVRTAGNPAYPAGGPPVVLRTAQGKPTIEHERDARIGRPFFDVVSNAWSAGTRGGVRPATVIEPRPFQKGAVQSHDAGQTVSGRVRQHAGWAKPTTSEERW